MTELPDGSDLIHVETVKDSRGYVTEMRLNRDLTQTLVTGYNVPLRLAVIKRLNELEGQVAEPVLGCLHGTCTAWAPVTRGLAGTQMRSQPHS